MIGRTVFHEATIPQPKAFYSGKSGEMHQN